MPVSKSSRLNFFRDFTPGTSWGLFREDQPIPCSWSSLLLSDKKITGHSKKPLFAALDHTQEKRHNQLVAFIQVWLYTKKKQDNHSSLSRGIGNFLFSITLDISQYALQYPTKITKSIRSFHQRLTSCTQNIDITISDFCRDTGNLLFWSNLIMGDNTQLKRHDHLLASMN